MVFTRMFIFTLILLITFNTYASQKLTADDSVARAVFGYSISASGNRILVGSPGDNEFGISSGAAYIFEFSEGEYSQIVKLTADDAQKFGVFGESVSLSGDIALVASPSSDTVYVFELINNLFWTQTAKIKADHGQSFSDFGHSISVSGDRALIASRDDPSENGSRGSVYIYDKHKGVWEKTIRLFAEDGNDIELFGQSVSLSGDRAIIGSWGEDFKTLESSGSAYIYDYSSKNWNRTTKLEPDKINNSERFGYNVSIDGNSALIGVVYSDDIGPPPSNGFIGAAYIFEFENDIWSQKKRLSPANPSPSIGNDFFGGSVSIFKNYALIGAYGDSSNGQTSGSAYLFYRNKDNWTQVAKLTASDGSQGDTFGYSVSLLYNHAIISSPYDDGVGVISGSAYAISIDLIFSNDFE